MMILKIIQVYVVVASLIPIEMEMGKSRTIQIVLYVIEQGTVLVELLSVRLPLVQITFVPMQMHAQGIRPVPLGSV